MNDDVFVDTNIFVYAAVKSDNIKHRIASDLLLKLPDMTTIGCAPAFCVR
jgi:predicted nucleic acid-binding protein